MAGPWDDYASQAPAAASPPPWEEYASVKVKDAPVSLKGEGWDKIQNYSGKDAMGGLVRGAGSIGATLLRPFESSAANADRRSGMDAGLSTLGANTDSTAFQTNKLVAEYAGTAGIGGGLGGVLARIPGLAKALPSLLPAIQTGGMTAGGATGLQGIFARGVGGAINGGATAGLVNPEDSGTGAMIGGAFPVVVKGLGRLGNTMPTPSGGLAPNPTKLATAKEGMAAGYVLPPATLNPTFMNRSMEAFSGKDATKQLVSMRNSDVTEGLVRKSLGITDDVPLTQGTLENLRKTAGKAYADVSAVSPQAAADLEALKQARNDSQGWFKAYNRSASPDDLAKAKAGKAISDALETTLEGHAQAASLPELIPALRDSRKQIAKTYTVGRTLNDASGTVDARILGRMYEKGLPLSDGLDTAGKFASAFPTANKTPMQMGSPAVSKLAAVGSGLLGSGGFAAMGPAGIAAATLPFIVPPLARARMFSDSVQRGLLSAPKGPGALQGLLSDTSDEALQLMYRSGGLLGNGR